MLVDKRGLLVYLLPSCEFVSSIGAADHSGMTLLALGPAVSADSKRRDSGSHSANGTSFSSRRTGETTSGLNNVYFFSGWGQHGILPMRYQHAWRHRCDF